VHTVGTNTAGFSPAEDSGTDVLTGIVVDGPTDAVAVADPEGKNVMVDVSRDVLAIGLGSGALDGRVDGEAELVGATTGAALRLPACLPTKNAATHNPIRTTNPATARFRLLNEVIELTWPVT
jgi:hypothetical protein